MSIPDGFDAQEISSRRSTCRAAKTRALTADSLPSMFFAAHELLSPACALLSVPSATLGSRRLCRSNLQKEELSKFANCLS